MMTGKEYRPITDQLKRTGVYAIATLAPLQRSAGRELERHAAQSSNWLDEAEQSEEWLKLQ